MIGSRPSISVAMCVYNGEKYLREQLESIVGQTLLPCELVICDDGSTDTTPQITAEFAVTAPFPVRFFHNPENLGSTKNFEQAISLCSGDLIALCDQDDVWMADKLACQAHSFAHDSELGGLFSDARLINDRGELLGEQLWNSVFFDPRRQNRFKEGQATQVLLNRNVVTGATLMFRASLRPYILPIPRCWVHDGWIAWMIVTHSKLEFTSQRLVHYRIHPAQQAGVEELGNSRPASLRKRLQKGRAEEPAKQLALAQETQKLISRLGERQDARWQDVVLKLRQRSEFLIERSAPNRSRLSRVAWILRNAGNYRRYENGWKSLLREIAMMFV